MKGNNFVIKILPGTACIILERTKISKNQFETQQSDFKLERRRDGASELSPRGGSERYEVRADEVKLKRAQGECLGIRSRRRT